MNSTPDVSVIIPSFRRPEALRSAIESALAEPIPGLEVIVVDDDPDRSAEPVVASYAASPVAYHAMPESSRGVPAHVRNFGMDRASGEVLYFLDDDDRIVPGGLTALVRALDESPHADVAFGRVECVGPDAATRRSYQNWFDWAGDTARRTSRSSLATAALIMFRGTLIINSACAIRADAARAIGGYDPDIPVYEDVEFFLRGIRRGGHVFVDTPVLRYQTGMPSMIHDLHGDTAKIERSYAIMHQKYRDDHGVVDYRLLQLTGKFLPVGAPREVVSG